MGSLLVVLFCLVNLTFGNANSSLFSLLSSSLADGVGLRELTEEECISMGFVGRFALVATRDLDPPMKLGSIDLHVAGLSSANVTCKACTATEKLMLRLCGEDVPPWISEHVQNSPLTWPAETRDLLKGTQVHGQLSTQIVQLEESFNRIVKKGFPNVGLEDWVAAFATAKGLVKKRRDIVSFLSHKQIVKMYFAGLLGVFCVFRL